MFFGFIMGVLGGAGGGGGGAFWGGLEGWDGGADWRLIHHKNAMNGAHDYSAVSFIFWKSRVTDCALLKPSRPIVP